MADVFEAHDEQLDRPVAVKLLRGIDDAGAARRFAEEIRLTARVNHPNIVGLYDAGEHDGSPYLILERVTGGTLAGEMAGGPMEPRRVAALGEQLASALSHSHAAGIVHRDVKPTNVLLTNDGSVRLADFGIAVTATATRLTVAGTIAGSAGYVSPEQVLGSGAAEPSDVYALGLVLLECLTGAPPWSGTTVEVALARISADPAIPDDLPEGWAPLLAGMTARKPEDRPHIDLVGHALSRLAAGEPYDTSLVAPPPAPDRRIPAVAGMSMLVLLLSALMVLTTDATPDVALAGAAPSVSVPAADRLLTPAVALSPSEAVPDWVVVEAPRVAKQARSEQQDLRAREVAAGKSASSARTSTPATPATRRTRTRSAPRDVATADVAEPARRPVADQTAQRSDTTTRRRRDTTSTDTNTSPTRTVSGDNVTNTRDTNAVKVSTSRANTVDKDELTAKQLRKRRAAKLRAATLQERLERNVYRSQAVGTKR